MNYFYNCNLVKIKFFISLHWDEDIGSGEKPHIFDACSFLWFSGRGIVALICR